MVYGSYLVNQLCSPSNTLYPQQVPGHPHFIEFRIIEELLATLISP